MRQPALTKVIGNIVAVLEGAFGSYLPPVITDDMEPSKEARIRAEAEQKGLPVIVFKGVDMSEYQQRERELGNPTHRGN